MIVGWSGLPTPWTHFSNIDFPYPEIISAITDPHFEIISQGWGDVSMLKFQELNKARTGGVWVGKVKFHLEANGLQKTGHQGYDAHA